MNTFVASLSLSLSLFLSLSLSLSLSSRARSLARARARSLSLCVSVAFSELVNLKTLPPLPHPSARSLPRSLRHLLLLAPLFLLRFYLGHCLRIPWHASCTKRARPSHSLSCPLSPSKPDAASTSSPRTLRARTRMPPAAVTAHLSSLPALTLHVEIGTEPLRCHASCARHRATLSSAVPRICFPEAISLQCSRATNLMDVSVRHVVGVVPGNVVVGAFASQQGPSRSRIVVALQRCHEFSAPQAWRTFQAFSRTRAAGGGTREKVSASHALAKPIVLDHHGALAPGAGRGCAFKGTR